MVESEKLDTADAVWIGTGTDKLYATALGDLKGHNLRRHNHRYAE